MQSDINPHSFINSPPPTITLMGPTPRNPSTNLLGILHFWFDSTCSKHRWKQTSDFVGDHELMFVKYYINKVQPDQDSYY